MTARRQISGAIVTILVALGLILQSVGSGAGHGQLPRGLVAVPGPWQYRWVPVQDPPPGTPAMVRQRYRIVHYVSAVPLP